MISEANLERQRSHWTSEIFLYLNPILIKDLLPESVFLLLDSHSRIMNKIPKIFQVRRDMQCDKSIYVYHMVFFFSYLNLRDFTSGFKWDWNRVKCHDNYIFVNSFNLQRAVNTIPEYSSIIMFSKWISDKGSPRTQVAVNC